jgi:Ca-activated chloride channel homolog
MNTACTLTGGLTKLSQKTFSCGWPLVFVLCLSSARLCAAQEVQAPTIRVEVSRVNVGVTVTGRSGNFVEGLQKSDFHIFDNGVEQPIAGFLANDDPAQVVLMLECGPSMYFFGKESVQRADALITNLAPNDRVAIVCYSSNANIEHPLSEDKSSARIALRELNFAIGSGNLDLSRSLLTVLEWLNRVPGKKTVVLIGSGVDSAPPDDANVFQERISASEVRVLTVSTSRQLIQPPKHRKRLAQERESRAQLDPLLAKGDDLLRKLAETTGGRSYFPRSVKEYEKTYAEIAQIVRHEYNLAFAPQTFDARLHTITVTANRGDRIDHRQAYLAPPGAVN